MSYPDKLGGHLAIAGAYTIFGLNIVFCKDIANAQAVSPIVLFTLRAIGASFLFWLISFLFMPKEKVDRRDFPKIFLASCVGLFVPQFTFLKAITMSTSIDTAILSTLGPIFTMFFAFFFLGEPITGKKAGGVALSFAGVIFLIFNSVHQGGASNTTPFGIVLLLINSLSFALYLGAFRPLISKYNVVTFMKWMFLFSLLISLPFSMKGLLTTDFAAVPVDVRWEIGYLIVFATFVAYFLIPLGQKRLRPTLVSMYTYLQPVIAAVVSIFSGLDVLTWQKLLATILIVGGVVLVSRSRAAAIILAIVSVSCGDKEKSPADYVNPFIGASTNTDVAGVAHGLGKTFPGATTPFGMVQVSPNTITGGDNGPGYSYEMKTIEGFAMTQMSGIGWYGDLGNFLVMPTTGPLKKISGKEDGSLDGWRSFYDKATETASPGYYSVNLTNYDIKVECSATPRCGILRFTWPESDQSRIQVDLARRVGGTSEEQYVKIIDDRTIEGWMRCTPETGGWGNGSGQAFYTVYFHAEFDKPLKNSGFWSADIPDDWPRKNWDVTSKEYLERVAQAPVIKDVKEIQGKHIGFFTEFPTKAGESSTLKVGISFVDIEGARKNFEAEIADKSFDKVHSQAVDSWNRELSKISVKGGTEADKVVFYTCLYHTMIDPRLFADVDGRYYGGDHKPHSSGGKFDKRTIFSGWDVFRSQMPLQTLINPKVVDDMMSSLVTLAQESGKEYLERWEFLNAYSGCMLGNPAASVAADAFVKGIRGFDAEKALEYAINSSARFGNYPLGWNSNGASVSETLEHAYSDWCIAVLAEGIGDKATAEEYYTRSQAYKNVFDPEVGWFRPRNADGTWWEWPEKGRLKDDFGCVESNPYQQGWFVPHDVDGMVELMGGREKVLADLENFFENAPDNLMWNSYYNHANEPVHHIPFLFNALGQPWETQKWTRFICSHAYSDDPMTGLVGNDDVGQMSAWYVLAASGIHPLCPGDGKMQLTSPVFDEIIIHTDPAYASGEPFIIKAIDNSPQNIYIQSATLDGKPVDEPYLLFSQIASGGTLVLKMGAEPNRHDN